MHTGYVYLSKLTKDKEREGNKFVKDATMFRLSYTQSVTGCNVIRHMTGHYDAGTITKIT